MLHLAKKERNDVKTYSYSSYGLQIFKALQTGQWFGRVPGVRCLFPEAILVGPGKYIPLTDYPAYKVTGRTKLRPKPWREAGFELIRRS